MDFEELLEVNKKLESQKSELEQQKSELETRLSLMQFQIDQMNRLLFGAKRERFIQNRDENQMVLPFDIEQETTPEKQQETITYVRSKTKRVNHAGHEVHWQGSNRPAGACPCQIVYQTVYPPKIHKA